MTTYTASLIKELANGSWIVKYYGENMKTLIRITAVKYLSDLLKSEPIYLMGGSGYGDKEYIVGSLIYDRNTKQIVKIEKASKVYHSSDGMSVGVGENSGYIYRATAVKASESEIKIYRKEQQVKKDEIKRLEDIRQARIIMPSDGWC